MHVQMMFFMIRVCCNDQFPAVASGPAWSIWHRDISDHSNDQMVRGRVDIRVAWQKPQFWRKASSHQRLSETGISTLLSCHPLRSALSPFLMVVVCCRFLEIPELAWRFPYCLHRLLQSAAHRIFSLNRLAICVTRPRGKSRIRGMLFRAITGAAIAFVEHWFLVPHSSNSASKNRQCFPSFRAGTIERFA
jgi:hypothetical protein